MKNWGKKQLIFILGVVMLFAGVILMFESNSVWADEHLAHRQMIVGGIATFILGGVVIWQAGKVK